MSLITHKLRMPCMFSSPHHQCIVPQILHLILHVDLLANVSVSLWVPLVVCQSLLPMNYNYCSRDAHFCTDHSDNYKCMPYIMGKLDLTILFTGMKASVCLLCVYCVIHSKWVGKGHNLGKILGWLHIEVEG